MEDSVTDSDSEKGRTHTSMRTTTTLLCRIIVIGGDDQRGFILGQVREMGFLKATMYFY